MKILIMGAGSGIGLAMAEKFAAEGMRVGVAARRSQPLQELAARYPDRVVWSSIDINDAEAPAQVLALIDKMGGLDTYVHVSGIYAHNPQLDAEAESNVARTNVMGFTAMIDTVFNYFVERGQAGHIAAITSVAGTRGIGDMPAYSASKSYDRTYLEALQQLVDARKLPISITDIRPGWIRTPLVDADRDYMLQMNLDKALPLICRAVMSRRKHVTIGLRWRIVVALWRMLPTAIWTRTHIPMSKPRH